MFSIPDSLLYLSTILRCFCYARIKAATPKRTPAAIRIRNNIPRQPNERPKQPYFGSAPTGSGDEISAAMSPINGVKITEIRNAQPKPKLRRLPRSPTKISSNKWPDNNPKVKIENIIIFSF